MNSMQEVERLAARKGGEGGRLSKINRSMRHKSHKPPVQSAVQVGYVLGVHPSTAPSLEASYQSMTSMQHQRVFQNMEYG